MTTTAEEPQARAADQRLPAQGRSAAARVPLATYRVQFNRGFTFHDAARLVPYLGELGISDLYASPYLKASAESTHGYDVADPARDLGRFLAALRHSALSRLGSIRALDATADVFLRTYLGVGQPEVKRNLRFYEAAACLKLAKHSFYHARLEKMEATLDEGLRVLEREAL